MSCESCAERRERLKALFWSMFNRRVDPQNPSKQELEEEQRAIKEAS